MRKKAVIAREGKDTAMVNALVWVSSFLTMPRYALRAMMFARATVR